MKKILLSAISMLFLCMSQAVIAQDKNLKIIKPMVVKYANLIGCADWSEVKAITKYSDKENGIEGAYVALIPSDIECAGGSGTTFSTIVVINTAEGRAGMEGNGNDYWKVIPSLSQPIADVTGAPRSLDGIYQKNGQLFATGSEYGPNDANCCPSLKLTYKVVLSKKSITFSKEETKDFYKWTFTKVK
nr:hypothetical protein [uncultured Undibacterium sp.]